MEAAFAAAHNSTSVKDIKTVSKTFKETMKPTIAPVAIRASKNLETSKSSFLSESSNKENSSHVNSLLTSSSNNTISAARIGAKEGNLL
jgi:hypothetical protein